MRRYLSQVIPTVCSFPIKMLRSVEDRMASAQIYLCDFGDTRHTRCLTRTTIPELTLAIEDILVTCIPSPHSFFFFLRYFLCFWWRIKTHYNYSTVISATDFHSMSVTPSAKCFVHKHTHICIFLHVTLHGSRIA